MKHLFTIAILLALYLPAAAQPSLRAMVQRLQNEKQTNPKAYHYSLLSPVQLAIRFNNSALSQNSLPNWLGSILGIREGIDSWSAVGKTTTTHQGIATDHFEQYFKGIHVAHGTIKSTYKNGHLAMMMLEWYGIPNDFNIIPQLTEQQAYHKAAAEMQLNEKDPAHPAGELVIVRTYLDDSSTCLAWKFDVLNPQPLGRAWVYIDANTGRLVLKDAIIKHVNTPGTASTRYNGSQSFVTDNIGLSIPKPYRLRQSRNGHNIITLNYQRRAAKGASTDSLAKDFTDNDNNWTAAEFANSDQDDAALDVHYNMQIVSDYWKTVHNRNSWDDANGDLKSYVHVQTTCGDDPAPVPMDNAYWNRGAMYYGDGSAGSSAGTCTRNYKALVTLDITAHEVGHGLTESMSGLIYRWESGALSESFSDMWAAIIEQWGKEQNPSIAANKNTWLIGEEMTPIAGRGIRNMQSPGTSFNHPSTYQGNNWLFCSYPNCVPNNNNDNGGVHRNSGVPNKWFYLITAGEAGTNSDGVPYNVAGMGFTKSRELVYVTALNLTPNASFNTAKAVSLDAAVTLYGATSAEVETVRSAWRAVGVDSAIWDISNTPVFATANNEAFTCIEVGFGGDYIWAGTDKKGLYQFDGTDWYKRTEIANVRINDIKHDQQGGIWVAQSGTVNSSMATAGGVNYFETQDGAMTNFYTNSTVANVPSRNVRSLWIDETRESPGFTSRPKVWIATSPFLNDAGNFISGRIATGVNGFIPAFTGITAGLNTSNTANGTPVVSGNRDEVWTFANSNNNNLKQILCYNAETGALINTYDNSTHATIPTNFTVTAIYCDAFKRTWFGLTTNAILVRDQFQNWYYITIPSVFVAGSQTNPNAITGNNFGDVYIGTTAGLVFFSQGISPAPSGYVNQSGNYRLYKKQHGLPSSNVTGIAFDPYAFKLWLATDKGICRWDPLCLGKNCNVGVSYLTKTARTAQSGNWSDVNTWQDKQVPDSNTVAIINHNVAVDINGLCMTLQVAPTGSLVVNAGKKLQVITPEEPVISGRRPED